MSASDGRPSEHRVRFVAEPQSVPVARRFVTDSVLGSGLTGLADDAALLATELSSNAALHSGSRYFDVVVQASPHAVRIGVADEGHGAAGVVPRRSALATLEADDGLDPLAAEATTGRGLVIVSAVADRWGVHETDAGKVVWGELSAEGRDCVDREHSEPERLPRMPVSPEAPPEWVQIQMVDLPVDLARRHDEHLWELVRELQLVSATPTSWTVEMAGLIHALVERHSASWRLSETVVDQAAAEGLDNLTLELVVPVTVVEDVQTLEAALQLTDRLCERDALLTLAAPSDVRRVRAWMASEIVGQIRDGVAPVPWPEYERQRPDDDTG
ncbi:MAG: ATP-binding protein [Nocardioidaceae bacterium]